MVPQAKLAITLLVIGIAVFAKSENSVHIIDLDKVSPCGGVGEVTDIRIPRCTAFPCLLLPGNGAWQYLAEVDFVPANSHQEGLQVDAVLTTFNETSETQVSVFSQGPFDMKITKGYTYTLTYKLALPFTTARGDASLQFSFMGSSGEKEVCVDLVGMFEVK